MMGVYWLMRRTGRSWWLWSGALTAVVFSFVILLAPVLIEPLFNKYEPVPPGQVRDAVVGMAGRAGIPPNKVYMFNGSRQSNNFTANAGGVGSTARVAISDVAFKNASLDEVRAVTGHEIGHYVLKHTWWGILFYSIAAIVLFWIADRAFPWFARAVRKHPRPCRAARYSGAVVHGLAVRPAALAALQHVQPDARDAGGHLFAADRKPAGRACRRRS